MLRVIVIVYEDGTNIAGGKWYEAKDDTAKLLIREGNASSEQRAAISDNELRDRQEGPRKRSD